MLAEERFALILNLLAEKRTATVQELGLYMAGAKKQGEAKA